MTYCVIGKITTIRVIPVILCKRLMLSKSEFMRVFNDQMFQSILEAQRG
jgi:hypothetical protein